MFKLILFLLVALGAALYFPTSRVVVLDVAEPVLNPVMEWSTKGEMRKIARDLETFERSWESLPTQDGWSRWLETKYTTDDGKTDSWGNDYALQVWPDSFAVVSAGVDGQMGTQDDLKTARERVAARRR